MASNLGTWWDNTMADDDTTPNEELRKLAERWRRKAPEKTDSEPRRVGRVVAHQCADELEEVLNDD